MLGCGAHLGPQNIEGILLPIIYIGAPLSQFGRVLPRVPTSLPSVLALDLWVDLLRLLFNFCIFCNYRLQTKLWEGNFFTPVSYSVRETPHGKEQAASACSGAETQAGNCL